MHGLFLVSGRKIANCGQHLGNQFRIRLTYITATFNIFKTVLNSTECSGCGGDENSFDGFLLEPLGDFLGSWQENISNSLGPISSVIKLT